MNTVIIKGRLTADPKIRAVGNIKTCDFNIAVDINDEETDVFECTAYAKEAEFITDMYSKGDEISITGMLRNRRSATVIAVQEVSFRSIKKEQTADPEIEKAFIGEKLSF